MTISFTHICEGLRECARVILSYVSISLAALLVMFVYLHLSLKRLYFEQTVSKLAMNARMNGQHLSNTLPTNFSYDAVDELVDNLDTEDFARITFIDPSGNVWGDTANDGDALKDMDKLHDRPEITAVRVVDEDLVVIHDVSQLRKLERVRVDFVTNVSHEIWTPLTSIQGFAETLLTGVLNDSNTNRRLVEKILQKLSALSRLVTDLLDLSRLESGMATLTLEPCDLGVFRAPLLNLFGPILDDAKLTLDWEVADDMPPVMVDKRLMEQTFANLIDNAIKYTSAGGKITVSSSINDSQVVVHIRDTGIGISSEVLPRIFERFYRVDKARSSEIGGTGLGLAIAKHILLQHDGQIWAESVLGERSVFHFALPLIRTNTTDGNNGTRP